MYYYVKYDKNMYPLIVGTSSFKQDINISKEEYDILLMRQEKITNYIQALLNNDIILSDIPNDYIEQVQYKMSLMEEIEEVTDNNE